MKHIIVLLLIFSVVGCESEDNLFNHSSKPKFFLLKNRKIENDSYVRTNEYIYSGNKLITVNSEYINKSSNTIRSYKTKYEYINEDEYHKYYYNSDNEITSKYRYFKPNQNTIRTEKLDPLSGELKSYLLMEIGNFCGATKYYSYDNNILTEKAESSYYGSNCSNNTLIYDGIGNFTGKYQQVKDNMKSPYITPYMINFNKIDSENLHNRIEYTRWDENNIFWFSETSTFEYNKGGYPIFEEKIIKYNNGTTSVTTVYYDYY